MKRVLKSFCTIGLALPVVFSLMGITSFAAGGGSKLECDILEEGQADVIAEQLEKCITNKYQGYYTFDNFRPTFYNEQYAMGFIWLMLIFQWIRRWSVIRKRVLLQEE